VGNRRKRGQNNCHLSERAEEDPKEAKEAVPLFNVSTVDLWCHVTKLKGPLVVYPLLSLNLQKSLGKKAHS